eukprot:Tbor_TRINITY_DN6148_c0_g1::TRINITY_DN6148_c0_g1_i1::g.22687::m.22687
MSSACDNHVSSSKIEWPVILPSLFSYSTEEQLPHDIIHSDSAFLFEVLIKCIPYSVITNIVMGGPTVVNDVLRTCQWNLAEDSIMRSATGYSTEILPRVSCTSTGSDRILGCVCSSHNCTCASSTPDALVITKRFIILSFLRNGDLSLEDTSSVFKWACQRHMLHNACVRGFGVSTLSFDICASPALISVPGSSVTDMLNHAIVVPTGFDELDSILLGGIPCGFITELIGDSGVGKTRLCELILARFAVSVAADRIEERELKRFNDNDISGIEESLGYCCLYVDVDGTHPLKSFNIREGIEYFSRTAASYAANGVIDDAKNGKRRNYCNNREEMQNEDDNADERYLTCLYREALDAVGILDGKQRESAEYCYNEAPNLGDFIPVVGKADIPVLNDSALPSSGIGMTNYTSFPCLPTLPPSYWMQEIQCFLIRNRCCKLLVIDSITTLIKRSYPGYPEESRERHDAVAFFLQELKDLAETLQVAVFVTTHHTSGDNLKYGAVTDVSPFEHGPSDSLGALGNTFYHAVNTRMHLEIISTMTTVMTVIDSFSGCASLVPSVQFNRKGEEEGDCILKIVKSPVAPPAAFRLKGFLNSKLSCFELRENKLNSDCDSRDYDDSKTTVLRPSFSITLIE